MVLIRLSYPWLHCYLTPQLPLYTESANNTVMEPVDTIVSAPLLYYTMGLWHTASERRISGILCIPAS